MKRILYALYDTKTNDCIAWKCDRETIAIFALSYHHEMGGDCELCIIRFADEYDDNDEREFITTNTWKTMNWVSKVLSTIDE